jgi:hypothetical protein
MNADIDAARRDIEQKWNEERHAGGGITWHTELSADVPGWVVMRPVPPEAWK